MMANLFPDAKTFSSHLGRMNQQFSNRAYSGKFLYDFEDAACIGSIFKHDYPFFVHYLNRLTEDTDALDEIWGHLRKNRYASSPNLFRKYQWILEYLQHYAALIPPGSILDGKFKKDPL